MHRLNLPQKHKMTPAAYADMKNKDIPVFADGVLCLFVCCVCLLFIFVIVCLFYLLCSFVFAEKAGVNVRVISGEFKSLKNTPAKFVQALLYEVCFLFVVCLLCLFVVFMFVCAGSIKGRCNSKHRQHPVDIQHVHLCCCWQGLFSCVFVACCVILIVVCCVCLGQIRQCKHDRNKRTPTPHATFVWHTHDDTNHGNQCV